MFELLSSLLLAVVMVPIVMASMISLIYIFGEVFNWISDLGHKPKSFIKSS